MESQCLKLLPLRSCDGGDDDCKPVGCMQLFPPIRSEGIEAGLQIELYELLEKKL